MNIALLSALLLQVAPDSAPLRGARSPAYAPDGRLAFAADGDIFVQRAGQASAQRVTIGLPWDRDPVWTRDGAAIVFASDRSGNYDLWRVTVAADGTAGTPARVLGTPQAETSPTVAPDGGLAFVRGSGQAQRVWVREANGQEHRLTTREQMENAPKFSPDGLRIAYISVTETGRRVYVRTVASLSESVANGDGNAERVAWSPTGDRLAYSSRAGVFVVPANGRWSMYASSRHGDVAWSPDGQLLAIAESDDVAVAYNGDPDRGLDRSASDRALSKDGLYFVNAPVPPDVTRADYKMSLPVDRATHNADAFDRVWTRSAQLYFSTAEAAARLALWESVKRKHRPAALLAATEDALQMHIYAMLKERPPLRVSATGRAAVSSAHPVATAAGLEILRAGGNVVDAAVAVSFALGVVEPDASGIGGYGEMVISLASMSKPTLIEFMSRVPEDAALSNTSLLQNGRYPADGPVLVNVPGTVGGMHAAWLKYGSKTVSWSALLQPAIRAARDGYVVSEGLATTLATEREHFVKYDGSRALFFRNGQPLVAGDTLRNPDLAWVLEQIAQHGADGFYKGEVAKKWVEDIHAKGNAMKLSDLARYFAPEREPVSGTYRGYTIYSSAPPVSGGAELVARLNLLEQFPKPTNYTDDANTLHAMLSAWFLVPSSRNRIADPALWPVDIAPIVNRDTARVRWGCFNTEKALRPIDVRGDTLSCLKNSKPIDAVKAPSDFGDGAATMRAESPCGPEHALEMMVCHAAGTTAFTVADKDGNAVAVTQTLGTWGGNFYVTPGLGFLSNDKLTSYGTDPTQYGSRLPFARHGSTLAPTIAFKGKRPVFAVGAAGNAWITSAVYETLIGALDFGLNPQQALELPRFLPGGGGGGAAPPASGAPAAPAVPASYSIQLEDGFAPSVIAKLRMLGYDLSFVSMRGELREGYGAAISIGEKSVTAGADPRRAGAAGAVKP